MTIRVARVFSPSASQPIPAWEALITSLEDSSSDSPRGYGTNPGFLQPMALEDSRTMFQALSVSVDPFHGGYGGSRTPRMGSRVGLHVENLSGDDRGSELDPGIFGVDLDPPDPLSVSDESSGAPVVPRVVFPIDSAFISSVGDSLPLV